MNTMPWTEKLKSGMWQHPYSALVVSALLTTLLFPVAKAPRNIAAVALILCALIGISVLRNPPQKIVCNLDLWAFTLVFLMPVLWFFHPGPGRYGAYARDSLFVFDMLALLYALRMHPVLINKVIHAVVAGTVLTAFVSLLQYSHLLPLREHGAAIGLHNGTLTGAFSLLLVFSAGVCSFLFRQATQWRSRWLLFAAMALCVIDLLLVVPGRTGYLAVIVLGCYILYNVVLYSRLLAAGVLLFALSAGFNSAVMSQRIHAAQSDLTHYSAGTGAATSVGIRFEMWKSSWGLFLDHPLFGAGTNGFKVCWDLDGFKRTGQRFDNPHNTYFYLLANYGIAGMVLLFFLFWRMARFAWLNRNNLPGAAILCYLVVLAVGSLTNTMLVSSFYLSWLAIMGGIMVGVSDKEEQL